MPEFLSDVETLRRNPLQRLAIASYREIARWPGEDDPTTGRMMEGILAVEVEQAGDLLGFPTEMGANPSVIG